uniref:Uncharacterized protein n=1 Tax=Heterorhabditis bacteriophora TaxID=37862 RepID=A0A1I7X2Y2_HETBA
MLITFKSSVEYLVPMVGCDTVNVLERPVECAQTMEMLRFGSGSFEVGCIAYTATCEDFEYMCHRPVDLDYSLQQCRHKMSSRDLSAKINRVNY